MKRNGIEYIEITAAEFIDQMSAGNIDKRRPISRTEQHGHTEEHFACDDYDIIVFVRNGEAVMYWSNRDS